MSEQGKQGEGEEERERRGERGGGGSPLRRLRTRESLLMVSATATIILMTSLATE